MVHWNVTLDAVLVEQRFLHHRSLAHHRILNLPLQEKTLKLRTSDRQQLHLFQHNPALVARSGTGNQACNLCRPSRADFPIPKPDIEWNDTLSLQFRIAAQMMKRAKLRRRRISVAASLVKEWRPILAAGISVDLDYPPA